MTDTPDHPGDPLSDEMSEYLQMFLDETEEQLEDLVETLLVLERQPGSVNELNEAFRLIHSIKGAAGMMGFDNIAVLTHHLESRFEAFRSGTQSLEPAIMNLVLRCIDFLRDCTRRLRAGEEVGSAAQLLEELATLGDTSPAPAKHEPQMAADGPPDPPQPERSVADAQPARPLVAPEAEPPDGHKAYHVTICFESGLQLADLKARLILSRLSQIAEIIATAPTAQELDDLPDITQLEVHLTTHRAEQELHQKADVDGVRSIQFRDPAVQTSPTRQPHEAATPLPSTEPATASASQPVGQGRHEPVIAPADSGSAGLTDCAREATAGPLPLQDAPIAAQQTATPSAVQAPDPGPSAAPPDKGKARVVETMRVDIDRLDNLLNLAGELVVNRARFEQLARQVNPALRKRSVFSRAKDFNESLRHMIERLEHQTANNGEFSAQLEELKSGLGLVEQQAELWDQGRRCLTQINEAIDQLTRISNSLQRGVLDTRMVPVAPLFNRFKRVVRDLSMEHGKKVHLEIYGEKTQLDKRMIDELGDPLVHLVRNSIDHGLESPEVRLARGKSEAGTIVLEAHHSGNNVLIHIRDDGGGIDVAKIKQRLSAKNILPPAAIEELSHAEALEYIWHAGFSTANEITDISGRGVGMDVVKTRISELNGTVAIDSVRDQGTTFTIRLPLTLAIINSLLIRLRDIIFSVPIDDVQEIVSVRASDIVTVRDKQTFDVRGEFILLVSIDDIFEWHDDAGTRAQHRTTDGAPAESSVEVVILRAAGRTMGLRVDELIGSQDIVIKSLTENFVHIPGLSGASILGDGTVCLMLDVGTVLDRAVTSSRRHDLPQGTVT